MADKTPHLSITQSNRDQARSTKGIPRVLTLFGGVVLFGQERGNLEVLASLKEQGWDVLCLVRDEAWVQAVPQALEARGLRVQRIPVIYTPRLNLVSVAHCIWTVAKSHWHFFRVLRAFRPTHIHLFNQTYVLSVLLCLLFSRTTKIYRAGDIPSQHNFAWRLAWKVIVRKTHRFVAISQFVRNALVDKGVREDQISVIYNCPPMRVSTGNSLACNVPHNRRMFVYIGQIVPHKGVHVLIEAFKRVAAAASEAHLLIAGRVDGITDSWARTLREAVLEDPLARKHISFLGEVEDVFGLLARSEVLVVPSLWKEPSTNVVVEAKSVGRPAIIFPSGGVPELVTHGYDGYICEEPTVESLARALMTYLENPDLSRTHGARARESCERLGVHQFAEKWRRVYVTAGGQMATP